jgi:hypothetical protein
MGHPPSRLSAPTAGSGLARTLDELGGWRPAAKRHRALPALVSALPPGSSPTGPAAPTAAPRFVQPWPSPSARACRRRSRRAGGQTGS